jgi:transposase
MIGCIRRCQETKRSARLLSPRLSRLRGVADHLPKARITFDKFHVVAHASAAVDHTRRLEQRLDPSLKGLRWTLLKDRHSLSAEARADLDALSSQAATKRTARAWLYREQLRAILERKQIARGGAVAGRDRRTVALFVVTGELSSMIEIGAASTRQARRSLPCGSASRA